MVPLITPFFFQSISHASAAASGSVLSMEAYRGIITGTVKDSKGVSLPGVSVKLKGTNTVVATDINGKFRINVPNDKGTLVFAYIGFKSREVTVTGQNALSVTLEDENVSLNDVVVIGYGTVKKRDLTGSVVSIKSSDVVATPTANVMDALQGKVVGMDIVKSSGQSGSGVNILLRGSRSIYGDNSPLFIIDGIPGSYSNLNPSDIESIDVLKDASSTAIYGSAGSNGVVIITTKKGKAGKTSVNFDAFYGVNGFPQFPHGMTGENYINLKREAYRGQYGNYPEFMNDIFTNPAQLAAYNDGKWVDWVDLVLDNSTQQNYSVGINGGGEKTQTYLSVNYNNEKGILKNDNFKKYVVRGNIDYSLSKIIKTGTNLQMTYTDGNARAQNVFGSALTFAPLGDPYNEDGTVKHIPVDGITNPLSDEIQDQYKNNSQNFAFAGNGFVDINPVRGLTFRSILGTTLGSLRTGRYFGRQSIANPEAGFNLPVAVIVNERDYNYRWENILTYNFKVRADHDFTLTGVTSWTKNQWEQSYAAGSGFDLDSYAFHNLEGATTQVTRSNYIGTQMMSYAARFNYNYKGKYLVTFSNRWDGVSRLSEGNKWDAFPAGAIAWRISDEPFFKGVKAVSNMKLRAGYGVTGNSGGVGAYGTQAGGYNAPKPVGFGTTTLGPAFILNQELANGSLGWEKSYNTNIGLDLEFLRGRINLTADYYNTDTKDLLYRRSMPASLGGSWGSPFKMWQNIGATNNKGIELMLNTQNISTKSFNWTTTINFAKNSEKITSLPGNKDLIADNLFLNQPISTFYNYRYLGIWQESEAAEAALYNSVPGDIKVANNGVLDANGRHTYNTNDRVILGSAVPNWSGGIQNNFSYKGFDASIFIVARWGQMMANNLITRYDPTLGVGNSPDDSDYWTPENPGAYLPRPGIHANTSGYVTWDALKYMDGSFWKIRTVSLGYTFPTEWIKKLAMQKARFYVTANNPYIYTKNPLLRKQDPERAGADNFPLTKQFVFGINVTF